MTDYIINDQWILDRISAQSSSFKHWISEFMNTMDKALDNIDSSLVGFGEGTSAKREISQAKNELNSAKKEIASLDMGSIGSKIGAKAAKWVTKLIKKQMKDSSIDFDENDSDIGLITGTTKSLSGALLDVSIEKGIKNEGILYLIKSLPDLEAFLYSTSVQKYYRDHTEHTLRVAVLGDFLLEQETEQGRLLGIISDILGMDSHKLKEKIWWITSLLHDVGYPLGKMSTAVNFSLLNQLLKCYPSLDLEVNPFEINLSWKAHQKNYLNIIEEGLSKKAKSLIRKGAGIEAPELDIQQTKTFLQQRRGHSEYRFESKYNLDHGVISALSLLKGLGTAEEIRSNDEYKGYIYAAKSIALHNFKEKLPDHNFDSQPLTFLLMLVDELQEWGRPIPVQVRDTYFTMELKKLSLLDEIIFFKDQFEWSMQFKNQKAKRIMNFNFEWFSREKARSFGRLDRGKQFTKTIVELQNILSTKKKKTDQVGTEFKIEI